MKWISKHSFQKVTSGFTLMELMIVIAIIGILSAISIPMLQNPEYRVKRVARDLIGDMQQAKMSAIRSNADWRIVFTANGYTLQDETNAVVKTIAFNDYAQGVQYGPGSATTNATSGGGVFPAGNISYVSDILTFNSRGTCNQGWVYLEYRDVGYAVGTLSTGIIKIRRWAGGSWR